MQNLPIYQNLDTSFVNLSALIRFLRERQFTGNVRVELDGYEADVKFKARNEISVYEHDRIAGRIAEGEEAFERLLIRARAPGGRINVYQLTQEIKAAKPEAVPAVETAAGRPAFVQKENAAPVSAASNGFAEKEKLNFEPVNNSGEKILPPRANAPLPVEFSNSVEERARQTQMTTLEDWETLLQLTEELLGSVDKVITAANLDFQSAFAKACQELADDYPFFKTNYGIPFYLKGKIEAGGEPVNAKIFAAGINEALRRILEKLGGNEKFAPVYRQAVQSILALIHRHKTLYDKFFITPQLEKNLGV